MSPVSVDLEVSLCKREGKISRKDMVHNVVHVGSLYQPLPLVIRVTRLPAHLTLLLHLRPCVVHGNQHSGAVGYDKDFRLLVHSHSTVEELACSVEGMVCGVQCVCLRVCMCVCVRVCMCVCAPLTH